MKKFALYFFFIFLLLSEIYADYEDIPLDQLDDKYQDLVVTYLKNHQEDSQLQGIGIYHSCKSVFNFKNY